MRDPCWTEAIEAAAKVARTVVIPEDCSAVEAHGRMMASLEAAQAIRALRRPEAARCDCGCGVHAIECDKEDQR